ncbi:hypothetical protein SK128_024890 [Halocaridina rubra]|uniref:Uncharacterized protein n=1 Tax=Halocaridina rubra TaxID=373956 RepID=A0AAN8WI97_HALRR
MPAPSPPYSSQWNPQPSKGYNTLSPPLCQTPAKDPSPPTQTPVKPLSPIVQQDPPASDAPASLLPLINRITSHSSAGHITPTSSPTLPAARPRRVTRKSMWQESAQGFTTFWATRATSSNIYLIEGH